MAEAGRLRLQGAPAIRPRPSPDRVSRGRTQASESPATFTLGYTPACHAAAVTHDRRVYVICGRARRVSAPLDAIQVFALRKDLKVAAPP